jgi:drug/metabolite transporter (DMT)-like permease
VSRRAWLYFAAVSFLWGIPYLFIKIAVDDGVPPAFLAWARVALGAAILVPFAWRRGLLGSLRGHGWLVVLYATIEVAIPWPLIGFGEQRVSSSLAAILIAASPLIVAVLALRVDRSERASGWRLAGLLIGFAGVVALMGIDVAGSSEQLVGAGLVLLAALCYGIGPMIQKLRLSEVEPIALMAAALAFNTVALAPVALIDPPDEALSGDALAAIAVLGIACTALALAFFGSLVAEVGPGRALVITYVAPVVAVAAGVLVLDESPGPGSLIGLLLILGGSWLSTRGKPASRPEHPEPVAPQEAPEPVRR